MNFTFTSKLSIMLVLLIPVSISAQESCNVKKELLCTVDKNISKEQLLLNVHAGKVAFFRSTGEGDRLVVNGNEKKRFEQIYEPQFAPAGTHLYYTARENDKKYLVVDGEKIGKGYETFIAGDPVISRDGQHFVYRARKENRKWFLVKEDQETGPFSGIYKPTISRRGSLYAAVVKRNKKVFVAIKNHVEGPYKDVLKNRVAVNGKTGTYAYAARDDKGLCLIKNGEKKNYYDKISNISIRPKTSEVYFHAARNGTEFVVSGGEKGDEFDEIRGPFISPTGKYVCYLGKENEKNKWFPVVNGKKKAPVQITIQEKDVAEQKHLKSINFLPGVVYFGPEEHFYYFLTDRGPVANGNTVTRFRIRTHGVFTRNGKYIANKIDGDRQAFVTINGITLDIKKDPDMYRLRNLSPGAKRIAYIYHKKAGKNRHLKAVINNKKYGKFVAIPRYFPVFDPSGNHWVCIGKQRNHRWKLLVDGDQCLTMRDLIGHGRSYFVRPYINMNRERPGKFTFIDKTTFRFFTRDGEKIYLVEGTFK